MAERNYIPLSKTLLSDPKVNALQARYGEAEGVGHWVISLLEMYGNEGRPIDVSVEWHHRAMAKAHGLDPEELDEMLSIMASVGLVSDMMLAEEKVYNGHVQEHVDMCREISEKRANAGRKGGESKRKGNA